MQTNHVFYYQFITTIEAYQNALIAKAQLVPTESL